MSNVELYNDLAQKIYSKSNILLGGVTNSGKEKFLINLLDSLRDDLRIVTICDTDGFGLKRKDFVNIKITQTDITENWNYSDVFKQAYSLHPDVIVLFSIYSGNVDAVAQHLRERKDIPLLSTIFSSEKEEAFNKPYYSDKPYFKDSFFIVQLDREGNPK